MIIQVKSYATLRTYTAHLSPLHEMEVPEGSTVAAVLGRLQVPSALEKITMVNGRPCRLNHILQPGDERAFFPPLEGG